MKPHGGARERQDSLLEGREREDAPDRPRGLPSGRAAPTKDMKHARAADKPRRENVRGGTI